MFRIPSGYAPNTQLFFKAFVQGGNTEVTWYMDTADNDWVRLLKSGSMSSNTTYTFCISFVR